jgi:protein phosphatase 2C family protein 2/3
LKANLANHILSSSDFPKNTKRALFSSFLEIDQCFLKQAKENGDISGSCALVLLIIGDKCFVANTGDSKAIISMGQGKAVTSITETHRPGETSEYNRIIQAGGRVFTDYIVNSRGENVNYGPHLVEPGKLKVSRTFGDLDAKDEEYGGNPNVIIADPHLKSFPVKKDQDFVFIATSSVFDRLNSREICDIVFKNAKFHSCKGIEYVLATAVEEVLAETVDRGCNENATAILIAFKGFQNFLEESLSTQG